MPFLPELIENIANDSPALTGIVIDGKDLSEEQKLKDSDIEWLCQALHFNHHIKSVKLTHHRISSYGAGRLAAFEFEVLDLSYNRFGAFSGVPALPASLRALYLNDTEWAYDSNPILAQLPHLKILELDNNRIDDSDMLYLKRSTSLETLSLVNHELTAEGIKVCLAIPTLKNVYLDVPPSQGVDQKRLHALLESILQATQLETLSLNGWKISYGIVDALACHPTLKRVSLKGCGLTDSLLDAFIAPRSIQQLNLSDNHFSIGGLSRFLQQTHLPHVEHNSDLTVASMAQRKVLLAHQQANLHRVPLSTLLHYSAFVNHQVRRRRSLSEDVQMTVGSYLMPPTLSQRLTRQLQAENGRPWTFRMSFCYHYSKVAARYLAMGVLALSMAYLMTEFNEDTHIPFFILEMITLGSLFKALWQLQPPTFDDVVDALEQEQLYRVLPS